MPSDSMTDGSRPTAWTRRVWRASFIALAVVIAIAALAPSLPSWPASLGAGADLLRHAGAFGVLAVVGRLGWPFSPLLYPGLAAAAALLELAQIVAPEREAHWDDLAASLAGVLLGALVYYIALRLGPRLLGN